MSFGSVSVATRQLQRAKARAETHGLRTSHDVILRRLLGAGDAIAVLGALAGALLLSDRPNPGYRLVWGLAAMPLLILLFKLYGLYDRDVKRISHSTVDDVPWLLHANVIGTLALWLYSKATPMQRLDFTEVLLFGVLVMTLVTGARFVVRTASTYLMGAQPALLVGTGDMAEVLVGKLAAHPEYRLNVVGLLGPTGSHSPLKGLPVLGTVDELERLAGQHRATRVIVSGDIDGPELEELLRRCRALSLKLSLLPQLSDVLGPAVEIDDVEGVTVLGVNPPWLPRSSRALKRALDVALAASLLLISAPLLALLGFAVKLESRGPTLFIQERVGRGGRRFQLLKLRTMVHDAEQRRADLLEQSTDPNWLKLDHDPRITRIGKWLRRLSLDELPQLWNVLRGEMSMVGPRPLIEAEDQLVEDWARGRLDLTPGLTGYWQVLGRTRIPFEEMVKLDYLYVMNWSLWEDVRLILKTVPVLVSGRGVN